MRPEIVRSFIWQAGVFDEDSLLNHASVKPLWPRSCLRLSPANKDAKREEASWWPCQ